MSFRWRLFIGVTAAVLLTAAVYGFLGYFAFRNSLDGATEKSMDAFEQSVLNALDVSGRRPTLKTNEAARTVLSDYGTSRFRVLRPNTTPTEFGGAFPEASREWQTKRIPLDNNYTLELAFNIAENRSALNSYLRTALLLLPAALGLAILLAFILQRIFLRPVRDLTKATKLLSQQAMPEPVAVPPGGDELSQLAESFNRMTDSLQLFIERERSFTRYASHELRTPLSNMRVLVEGMQKGILKPEIAYPQLNETLKRMEGILSGLLTLTRSVTVELEPVLLSSILQSALGDLPKDKRVRIHVMSTVSPIVLGRDDLIKQIVSNLILNALKYTSDKVEVTLEETPTSVRLSVRDYGDGVPANSLAKLTEPFFRVNKRKGGLGLGLALVKHIAISLKGTLEIHNAHKFNKVQPGLEAVVTFQRASELPEVKQDKEKEVTYA
jgi:signal transduction histidine kinase